MWSLHMINQAVCRVRNLLNKSMNNLNNKMKLSQLCVAIILLETFMKLLRIYSYASYAKRLIMIAFRK